MQVQLHDSLSTQSSGRERFILDRLGERLDRYANRVQRTTVSLSETGKERGHSETRCRISASLGPLGTVVVTSEDDGVHQAFSGALKQVTRGIQRRIERRVQFQRPVEPR